ncbi:MAG: hypothetical protein WCW14_03650 [Candidatus Paceibacterota bacterium]|jgi:hypothetical protein
MAKIERNRKEIEQIDLAAESLVQILVQQAISNRNKQINKKIENKYGKPN